MTRKLVPSSRIDRINAVQGFIAAAGALLAFLAELYLASSLIALWAAFLLFLSYVVQDQPTLPGDAKRYDSVLGNISSLRLQLENLRRFLEEEQKRAEATQLTVRELEDQRQTLEPIIKTQKESVEAILSAHAARTARSAWKERAYGFMFGTIASLVASVLYDRLK